MYIDNIIVTNNLNNGKALENYKIYISRYNGIKEDYDSFKNKKKLEEQRQLKEIAELRLSDYVSKFVYSFRSLNSNKFLTVSESVILRKRLENFSFTVNNKCAYIILGVKKEKDLFVFRYVSMTSNLTADIAKMKLFSDEDEANKICSKLNERKGVACRVINIFD